MPEFALFSQIIGTAGPLAQIAVAFYMWRLDRRIYRLELQTGVEK